MVALGHAGSSPPCKVEIWIRMQQRGTQAGGGAAKKPQPREGGGGGVFTAAGAASSGKLVCVAGAAWVGQSLQVCLLDVITV